MPCVLTRSWSRSKLLSLQPLLAVLSNIKQRLPYTEKISNSTRSKISGWIAFNPLCLWGWTMREDGRTDRQTSQLGVHKSNAQHQAMKTADNGSRTPPSLLVLRYKWLTKFTLPIFMGVAQVHWFWGVGGETGVTSRYCLGIKFRACHDSIVAFHFGSWTSGAQVYVEN
jgi:hypothetical protein